MGVKVLVDRKDPFNLKNTTPKTGAEVARLDTTHLIPDARIDRMVSGPVENFRVKSGLAEEDLFGDKPTIALWIQFEGREYKTHEFILAGNKISLKFSMGNFLGLSGHDKDTEVSAEVEPSSLKFRRGS